MYWVTNKFRYLRTKKENMEDITFDERKMYQSPNKKSAVVLVAFKSSIFLSPIYTNAWVDQLAVRFQELTLVHGTTNQVKLFKKRLCWKSCFMTMKSFFCIALLYVVLDKNCIIFSCRICIRRRTVLPMPREYKKMKKKQWVTI